MKKKLFTVPVSVVLTDDVRTDQGHRGHAGHWYLGLSPGSDPGKTGKQRTASAVKQEE